MKEQLKSLNANCTKSGLLRKETVVPRKNHAQQPARFFTRIKYSNYTHFSTSYCFGFSQRNLFNGITPWDSTAYTLSGLCWMVFACLFVTKFSLSSPICTLVPGCCQSSEILQSVAMQIYLGVSHHIVFTSYSSAHFWISKGAKVQNHSLPCTFCLKQLSKEHVWLRAILAMSWELHLYICAAGVFRTLQAPPECESGQVDFCQVMPSSKRGLFGSSIPITSAVFQCIHLFLNYPQPQQVQQPSLYSGENNLTACLWDCSIALNRHASTRSCTFGGSHIWMSEQDLDLFQGLTLYTKLRCTCSWPGRKSAAQVSTAARILSRFLLGCGRWK